MKNSSLASIVLLGLSLAGCVLVDDPDWGVKRSATIQSTPTEECTQRVLEQIPGVSQVLPMPRGSRSGHIPPEAMAYGFDIVAQTPPLKTRGAIQFVLRHGMQTYEGNYISAHYAPPQSDVDTMRSIFLSLEQGLATKCGVPDLAQGVVETCTHVSCPPLR